MPGHVKRGILLVMGQPPAKMGSVVAHDGSVECDTDRQGIPSDHLDGQVIQTC